MNQLKKGAAIMAASFVCLALTPVASAQIQKEKSIFTATESFEVGSHVVPPGTYLIRVVPLSYNRNVVQVTSEDGNKVFASALATPHVKKDDEQIPSSRFVYFPNAEGQPKALRTWFAPNTPYGQDIVYSKKRGEELAVASKSTVVTIPEETAENDYKTVPYTMATMERTEVPYVETTAPAPVAVAQVPDRSLPRTGSDLPLAALAGLAALGAGFALNRARS